MTIGDQIAEAFGELQSVRHSVARIARYMESTEGALVPLERAQDLLGAAQRTLLTARTWWVAEHPVQDPDQLSLEVTP